MKNRIILFAICLMLLCSCSHKTTEVQTVYRTDTISLVSRDTIRVTDLQRLTDSIVVRDTVRVTINESGGKDTERTKYVTRIVRDSTAIRALQSRCDSLTSRATDISNNTKTITKEVNRLRWWQTALCYVGAIALIVGIAIGVVKLKR